MKTIIVVENGMIGYKFYQRFIEKEGSKSYKIIVFGEEPRPAYDFVHLSEFFKNSDARTTNSRSLVVKKHSILSKHRTTKESETSTWFKVAAVSDFSKNGGACVKYKNKQITVFNFKIKNK